MVLLLALAGCYLGALELAARLLLPHLSQAQHRIAADYRVARSLPRTWPDGSASVLIVGNSLLVDGIDRMDLQRRMPGYHVALYPVEGTLYLDWYFGLRRLFSEGSRPALVVLAVSVRHVLSDSTDGDAFARSMMNMSDLPEVSRAAKLDMMSTSSYFFANLSEWLGTRAWTRDALLEKWLPGAPLLAAHLWTRAAALPVTATHLAAARLHKMQELCNSYGGGFALLIPPALHAGGTESALVAQAARLGVPVLLPFGPGEMPAEAFADGFHLNSQGAARFTERTAVLLRRAFPLSRPPPRASQPQPRPRAVLFRQIRCGNLQGAAAFQEARTHRNARRRCTVSP